MGIQDGKENKYVIFGSWWLWGKTAGKGEGNMPGKKYGVVVVVGLAILNWVLNLLLII